MTLLNQKYPLGNVLQKIIVSIVCFRENIALNIYVGLCYYKLDYYDVSQEVLGLYLNKYPDSVIATNLKVPIFTKNILFSTLQYVLLITKIAGLIQ